MSDVIRVNGSIFDESFFVEILRKHLRVDTVRLVRVYGNQSGGKGVNFLSDVARLCISYTIDGDDCERQLSVVMKTEPLGSPAALDIVRCQDLFVTEVRVLRDVLPRVEQILRTQIGPKLLHSSEMDKVIVMEDLAVRNFVMKDRQKGLSLRHCLLVIEKMAKLHAASVALYEKDPELVSQFEGGIVSTRCPQSFIRLMRVSLENVSRRVRTWPGDDWCRLADKLLALCEVFGENVTRAYRYKQGEFCVLNHGDCWTNNILFRENDKGEPLEVVMLDYQMSVYTSPAIDLFYFLSICPEIAVKCPKYEEFLDGYLTTLSAEMRRLGCATRPPTSRELAEAMRARRIYSVFAGLFLYPRMIVDGAISEDFEEVLAKFQGETKLDVFRNPDAVVALQQLIPFMDERGYLD